MKIRDQRALRSSGRFVLFLLAFGAYCNSGMLVSNAQSVNNAGLLSDVLRWSDRGRLPELANIPSAELSIGQRYDLYSFSKDYRNGAPNLALSEAFVPAEAGGIVWVMKGSEHKALVSYADHSGNQTDLRVRSIIRDGVPTRILAQFQTGDWIVEEPRFNEYYIVRGSQIIPISDGAQEMFPSGSVTLSVLQQSIIARLEGLNWDLSLAPPASQTLMSGVVISRDQTATAEALASVQTQTPTIAPAPQAQLEETAALTPDNSPGMGSGTATLVGGTLSLLLMLGLGLAVRARRGANIDRKRRVTFH